MAHADQLQPAGPERELVVGVDVVVPAFELIAGGPRAVVAVEPLAAFAAEAGVPIGRVGKGEVADRRAGAVDPELGRHGHQLGFRVKGFVPRLEVHARRVDDLDRSAEGAAAGIVLDRQGIVDRPALAGVADRAVEQVRLGIMGAEIGRPFELAGRLGAFLDDDVGDRS